MRSGWALMAAVVVSLGLLGCSGKKSNKQATILPPPPPVESEPLPASLASTPMPVSQTPAPAAPVYQEEPVFTPAPAAPAYGGRTYRVQKGDTLMSIARKEYNDASAWRKIAEVNSISDPNRILVGQQLVLP